MEEIVIIFSGAIIGFTVAAYLGGKKLSDAAKSEFIPLFIISSAGMCVGAVATKFYLDYNRRKF